MGATLLKQTTYSWEIMSIEANFHWRLFVCCLRIKSNTQKTFSYSEVIMNVLPLIEFMDSTMNVKEDITLSSGKRLLIVSTVYP